MKTLTEQVRARKSAVSDMSGGDGGVPGHAGGGHRGPGGEERPGRSGAKRWSFERWLPRLLALGCWVPLVALLLLALVLVIKAVPAIRFNGLGFFTRDTWDMGDAYGQIVTTGGIRHFVGESFGAYPFIVGTLLSSAIAVVIAIPTAVLTALIVVYKLPARLSSGVGFCLEVLAGVPSAIFGIWGVLTFGPWLAEHIDGPIARNMPDVPVLRWFRGEVLHTGQGLLTGGLVLAIMIIPIVAATSRDLFRQVPKPTFEGAVALGMTESEAVSAVTLPWVRSGIIGASMLGLGRALGETIAIAMISGALIGATPHSIFSTFNTIAAVIVTQLDAALSDPTGLVVGTLAELALILLGITLIANLIARRFVQRGAGTHLPVGRGL